MADERLVDDVVREATELRERIDRLSNGMKAGLLQTVPPDLKDSAALKLALECLKMALERRDVELTRLMGEVIQKIMNPRMISEAAQISREISRKVGVPRVMEDPHPGAEVEAPYSEHPWEKPNG